jgi:hypothetical protein
VDRNLKLTITVGEAGGATEVMLDATFSERQIHPWRNLPFETGCVSKGVLEKALLDAIRARPGTSPEVGLKFSQARF